MEKISCKIIEDLLPLYVDEVCSEESKNAVESHISACEDCKKKLEQMKQGLSQTEINNNLDESKMIAKLSSTWKENTKLSVKSSILSIVFYAVMIAGLTLFQTLNLKAQNVYYSHYFFSMFLTSCILWLLMGLFISFLSSRQRSSAKTRILEFIVVGIPALLMAFSPFMVFFMHLSIKSAVIGNFLYTNIIYISIIGCALLGCELFRAIKQVSHKKKQNQGEE